jgi:DNA-binding NarL/FixJ family response regulator
MRVLVVDDSAEVRTRIATLVRSIDGVEHVAEVEDATQAIHLARSMRPDYVILDLNLPGPSGLDILPRLKGLLRAPVVIVLTNHAGEAYARRCQELGADHFFDKSREFENAVEVVRAGVSARQNSRPG